MSNSGKGAAPITGLLSGKPLVGREHAERLAVAMREAAAHKRRMRPYTGDLAKPIEYKPGGGLGLSRDDHAAQRLADAEFSRRLLLLFEWHEVSPFDWRELALELARAHVPGLHVSAPKRGRGRPRKKHVGPITGLLDPRLFATPGKPGRPRKRSLESLRELIKLRARWREVEIEAGRKRATNTAFARWLCEAHAEREGEPVRKVMQEHYRSLLNDLSRAPKLISKP